MSDEKREPGERLHVEDITAVIKPKSCLRMSLATKRRNSYWIVLVLGAMSVVAYTVNMWYGLSAIAIGLLTFICYFIPPYANRSAESNETESYELVAKGADASLLELPEKRLLPTEANDQVLSMYGTMQDTAARKHAEEELLKAEALQRAIFNSANFFSIATDASGVIQIFNVGAARMLGYQASEVVNKLTPADISDQQEVIVRAEMLSAELETYISPGFEALAYKASRGIEDIYELTYLRKDGSRFPAVVSVTALRDAHQAIIGYLLIGTDNTARKLAEQEHRRQQQALRQSESQFETLANAIPQLCWIADPDGRIFWCNQRWYDYTGTTPKQMEGLGWESVHHPAEWPRVLEGRRASIKTGSLWDSVFPLRGKDGTFRTFLTRVVPLKDDDENVLRWFGTNTDITDLEQAEEKLRQSDEKMRLLVSGLKGYAIFMLDPDGFVSTWNQGAEAIKGYRAEEIIGCHLSTFYTPNQNASGEALRQLQIAADDGQFKGEGLRLRKDGSTFLAEIVITALRDEKGGLLGYGKVTHDITARKQAEADATVLLRTVHSHSIVSVTDKAGKIIEVNDSFCAISGYSREELITNTHQVVNSGTHSNAFWTAVWLDITHGKSWHGEICNRTRNGSLYWVDSIIAPFLGADGQTTRFISIHTDITSTKLAHGLLLEATGKAEQANRAKGEFLANMSHEVRTPMNAIMGMTHLARRANPPPAQEGYLSLIANASESLLNIINDVLDFSKIEAGKLKLEKIPFLLADLLDRVDRVVTLKAHRETSHVKVSVASDVPPWPIGDPLRLEQILINLVSNAIKFSGESQVDVEVAVEELTSTDGQYRFSVRHRGIGMSPDQISHLFEPFNQADTSITRKFGGTGLGLAITKQLCDLMTGKLTVESDPDLGSTFVFTVPFGINVENPSQELSVSPRDRSAKAQMERWMGPGSELPLIEKAVYRPDDSSSVLRGRRVLLVEDNSINLRVATELLSDLGIVSIAAKNGREAVDRIQSETFDLVLMDLQMPTMDGLTATRLIRADERFRDLPIIAMTAHAMSGDREKSIAGGMTDHFTKPIVPEKLTALLLQWMPKLETCSRDIPDHLLPFDIKAALVRTNQKPQLLREILFDFCYQYENAASELLALARQGKDQEAERLAHTIKSVAGTLEAHDLTAAAAALEAALRAHNTDALVPLIAALEKALAPAMAAVHSLGNVSIAPTQPAALPVTDLPSLTQRPCVLIVDDDRTTLSVLRYTFMDDFEILAAMDGLGALELAIARKPHVILLDVRMAGIDGFEVCRYLKANSETSDIPVMFITALDDLDAETKGLALGAVDYLTKPLNPSAVKARVENQISLKRTRDSLAMQTARAVAISSGRFASVLESTSDCVLIISTKWTILYANGNALQGLAELEVGRSYWACFPSLLGTPAERLALDAMQNRTQTAYESFYSPNQRWYRARIFPVDEGISIFFTDVTAEKQMQDQLALEQLLREKRMDALSHMAGGLAHEINNPLAIIQGRASELKRSAAGDEPFMVGVRAACESIMLTSDRAMDILRGLRGFSREASHDPMQLASIYEIAEQSLELQQARFEANNIQTHLHFEPDIPVLLCREIQIAQIVTNLLNNAFDAILQSDSTERWISLAIEHVGDDVRIDIIDSGAGIEDHFKPHLMEPFFTTRKPSLRMGVGLSLSRAIAQDHGGTLDLCQDTEHTCFRLVLPIEPHIANHEQASPQGVRL